MKIYNLRRVLEYAWLITDEIEMCRKMETM